MTAYTDTRAADLVHPVAGEHKGSYDSWRPISTAPKTPEGEAAVAVILGFAPDEEGFSPSTCEGFWNPPLQRWVSTNDPTWEHSPQPTHWMPLPDAPSHRSADNAVTGRITPNGSSPAASPILAAPASEQGEREAFDGLSAKLWCDLRTDEERSAWLLLGRGHETGVVAQALQNDLAMAYHRLTLLSASLRASPAVPVAQDERAEALQALVEALESFPGFAVDIGDERDTFVRKGKVALSLGRAALSAATPPAVSAEAQGEREAFEAAISSSPYERSVVRFPDNDSSAWPGSYRDIDVDLAWCMWQARAAVRSDTERDAARLDWLTHNLSGKALRESGVVWSAWSPEAARAAIDAAMGTQPAADNKENGND